MRQVFSTPWLKSGSFDLSFILLPSFLAVGLALFIANTGQNSDFPLWAWVTFVLCIDVSHVYSTLFRTYFNSDEFKENRILLTLIPLIVWIAGVALYSVDKMLFWRALAYVAVFHFIRQQYGFMRLYTRGQQESKFTNYISAAVIYLATLYPILFWHTNSDRHFHWFVDGDFWMGIPAIVTSVVGGIYATTLIGYLVNEIRNSLQGHPINIPKNAIVFGTSLSWYVGIVLLNGDMSFTITNVVSHGIPYMALVWIYGSKQKDKANAPLILNRFSYRMFFSKYSVPIFLGTLILFAWLEEGLWAGLVWREHLSVFAGLAHLPEITAPDTLCWLVPLLTLPQSTHYVLDGFIWKMKDKNANWQNVLLN